MEATCKQLEQEKIEFAEEVYILQDQLEEATQKGEELEQLVEKMGEQLKQDEAFKKALAEEQLKK